MRKTTWHPIVKRLLITGISLFILILAVWQLPAFRVQQIELPRLRSISEEELTAVMDPYRGQHFISGLGGSRDHWMQLRYRQIEEDLASRYPVIENVSARFSFPSGISLTIDERVEIAYVAIPDGSVMIDKHGVAMFIWPQTPGDIPVIEGIHVTSLNLGQPLIVDVPDALNSALTLMGAIIDADKDERLDLELLPQIRSIRPIGGRQLYLTVELPGTGEIMTVLAKTGHEQVEEMQWLRFALDQSALENRGKGVLDMTGERITFRPD